MNGIIYSDNAYNQYSRLREGDSPQELWEKFQNLADSMENEYNSSRISSLVTFILYKVAYARQSIILCDVWVLEYVLDKKSSQLRPKSMINLFNPVEEVGLDGVCERIMNAIEQLNDKYSSENAEPDKQDNKIRILINGKPKKSNQNENRRNKIDDDLKEYEERKRSEIDDNLNRYETVERKKIGNALEKYRDEETKRITKELEDDIQSQLSEYANKQREKIDEERELIIKAMKENSFDVQRKEEEEKYNKAVEEMPKVRREFNNQMSNQLRDVSREFRTSTSDISNDINNLVVSVAENLNQQVREATNTLNAKVSEAIRNLNSSANDIVKTLNVSTDSAVNSVVGIERALKMDDFDDLLQAYCQLDKQVYYRRLKFGEDSEEYKQYWKSVALYLKNFKRTLSKFGYEVFSPDVGSMPDDNVDIDENESSDYPDDATEYNNYIISDIISSGIRHKEADETYIEIKPLVKVKKK